MVSTQARAVCVCVRARALGTAVVAAAYVVAAARVCARARLRVCKRGRFGEDERIILYVIL